MSYPAAGFKDETAFNKWLRSRIRGRGYQCLHIREADTPGPLDLIVWGGRCIQPTWIELKLDDRIVEPSQLEFMRNQCREGVKNCVVRYRHDTERFEVSVLDKDMKALTVTFSTDNDAELLNILL